MTSHFKRKSKQPICFALTFKSGKHKECGYLRSEGDSEWYRCAAMGFRKTSPSVLGSSRQPTWRKVLYDRQMINSKKQKKYNFLSL